MVAVAKATVEVMAAPTVGVAVAVQPPSQALLIIAAALQAHPGLPMLTAQSLPMA
jgi:hypothetical protein